MGQKQPRARWRMIWAITSKDLVDALKNKQTLSILISVLFVVVMYRLLPVLREDDIPTVFIYDAGESALAIALENSAAVNARLRLSQEKMTQALAESEVPELGLVIPANFDRVLAADQAPALQGYVMHWLRPADVAELQQYVEAVVGELVGAPVEIEMGNVVYPSHDSGGLGVSTAMGAVFALVMVGVSFIPHLMLEEKHTKTLDVLLVSPAGPFEIAAAKALTGLVYYLLTVGVVFAINYAVVLHWGLALFVVVCAATFTVALGLLLGTLIATRQQLMLWAWGILLPLFLPMFLVLLEELVPARLVNILKWTPSAALLNVLRIAFAREARFALYAPLLAVLLGYAAVLWVGVVWRLGRADRR
jgi:ABC-2 type transport system permease protein